MVESLRDHVNLLEGYMVRARKGEAAYLGEIAGKLRLLVLNSGANKPLLLRLARLCDYELIVQLGDQPPIADGPKPFERIPLETWLDEMAVALQTPSSAPQLVQITWADLIAVWSQQSGAAHEDWSHSESFQMLRQDQVFIGGQPASQRALLAIGSTVLSVAVGFLNALTPEMVARAEVKRQTELGLTL